MLTAPEEVDLTLDDARKRSFAAVLFYLPLFERPNGQVLDELFDRWDEDAEAFWEVDDAITNAMERPREPLNNQPDHGMMVH
jgi:hypothetical protein